MQRLTNLPKTMDRIAGLLRSASQLAGVLPKLGHCPRCGVSNGSTARRVCICWRRQT